MDNLIDIKPTQAVLLRGLKCTIADSNENLLNQNTRDLHELR